MLLNKLPSNSTEGEGYFLVISWEGSASGWDRVFTTGFKRVTRMGSHISGILREGGGGGNSSK